MRLGVTVIFLLVGIVITAIMLFATWGATKLFNVDFFVTFQIMTFGQCLCTSKKTKQTERQELRDTYF